jgi:hypothetical protein
VGLLTAAIALTNNTPTLMSRHRCSRATTGSVTTSPALLSGAVAQNPCFPLHSGRGRTELFLLPKQAYYEFSNHLFAKEKFFNLPKKKRKRDFLKE